jgi:hypothetical protein
VRSGAFDFNTGKQFHGFHGGSLVVLVVAGVAAAAWLVWLGVRWFHRVPRLPPAGPETSDLGPEPPALVNMLVNRWRVTAAAVPATLIDLAARRVVGLEEVGPGQFVVRTKPSHDDAPLTSYEAHVLSLVEARATGGSAPVEVLQVGGAEDPWFSAFASAVVRDARERDLAQDRWSARELAALGAGLALVLALVAFAFGLAHLGQGTHSSRGGTTGRWSWFAVGAVVWIVVMLGVARVRTLRDTPIGRDVCARWLGVRAFLRRDPTFAEEPPAAVAIWGRNLAYGVALGVCHDAEVALPVGPDDPKMAWSREGGTWRHVGIEYRHRFGAGRAPGGVFAGGLARLLFWGAIGFIVLPVIVSWLWHAVHDVTSNASGLAEVGIIVLFTFIPAVIGVYVAVQIVDGAVRTWRGAADLRHTATVEGPVVKVHDGQFAVDDGHHAELVALPAGALPMPGVGTRVRVTYTPHLHHVTHLELAAAATPAPSD